MWKVIRYETETGANEATIVKKNTFKEAKEVLDRIARRAILRNSRCLGPDHIKWEVTYQKGRRAIIVKCGTPFGGRLRTFAIVPA